MHLVEKQDKNLSAREGRRRALPSWLALPILLALLGAAIWLYFQAAEQPPCPIRMSEVCCGNFTLIKDPETGDYPDYIEIVNSGEANADLRGYFLSDQEDQAKLFTLPSLMLEPGETLVLFADGTGTSGTSTEGRIHLNFSLKGGETVFFRTPEGRVIDRVTLAEPHKNISMSLVEGAWVQAAGTPGKSNDGAAVYRPATLKAPVLSLPAGFYDEPQILTLEADPGCQIRYTLDGSLPTAESSLYDGPITLTDISAEPNRILSHPNTTTDRSGVVEEPVRKGTLIRAAAFDGTGAFSETVTAVYFVGDFSAYEGEAVINLVIDPKDLFGDKGIAVTGPDYDAWLEAGGEGTAPWPYFMRTGRGMERDGSFILWDENRVPVLESACGVRLQGDSSRWRAIKRFSLYARPIYGADNVFPVPLFGERLSHSFFLRTNVHEVMANALAGGEDLGGLDAVRAAVFLNGEFYVDAYLRERYDKVYFETHFGVDEDDVILIADNSLDTGTEEDYADYQALMETLQQGDCADEDFYAHICRQIDVENYALFMATNLYLNNTDWSVYKNYRMWRTRSSDGEGFGDGRWRWLIYDLDGCVWTRPAFGDASRATYDIFSYPAPYTEESFKEMPVFRELLKSEDFRLLFVQTWLDLMNVRYSYEQALPLLERYGLTEDGFWPDFLRNRPGYALDILIRELELDAQPCALTLSVPDPDGGTIRVDRSSPDLSGRSWTGTWLTGIPVTLTAEPAEGWTFVGWQGDMNGSDAEITVTLREGDNAFTALFEKK